MTQGTQHSADDPRNADILISINGTMKHRSEAMVSVFDSGFVLGDGVWEGFRVVGGHPVFSRKGETDDLLVTVPISFPEAALGGTVQVPKPTGGTVSLRIPAGTSSGRRFRVKGQGVHSSKGQGNLIVTVEVAVPAELDDAAKKAVEDFAAATAGEDPRAKLMERAGA